MPLKFFTVRNNPLEVTYQDSCVFAYATSSPCPPLSILCPRWVLFTFPDSTEVAHLLGRLAWLCKPLVCFSDFQDSYLWPSCNTPPGTICTVSHLHDCTGQSCLLPTKERPSLYLCAEYLAQFKCWNRHIFTGQTLCLKNKKVSRQSTSSFLSEEFSKQVVLQVRPLD